MIVSLTHLKSIIGNHLTRCSYNIDSTHTTLCRKKQMLNKVDLKCRFTKLPVVCIIEFPESTTILKVTPTLTKENAIYFPLFYSTRYKIFIGGARATSSSHHTILQVTRHSQHQPNKLSGFY